MPLRRYHDFVILTDDRDVGPDGDGTLTGFTVRVFQSPAGEGERKESVSIPDPAHSIPEYVELGAQRRRLANRCLDLQEQIAFGRTLTELMLPPYARSMFRRSLSELSPGEGLRLRLRLLRELALFPWEYMYLQDEGDAPTASGFLILDPRISIVRHEAIATPPEKIPPGDVRRVLIAMATPEPHDTYEPLSSLPDEQQQIRDALTKIRGLDVRCLPDYGAAPAWETTPGASPAQVQASIQALQHVDLFHFSGHGDFPTQMSPLFGEYEGKGIVILADADNQAVAVPAERLQELLGEHGIRLVTLGACETGMRDIFNAWSSVAAALLKGRIPSVVAMQFGVKDQLAAAFMAALYQALVAGSTVDEAVFSGRAAIRALSYGEFADDRDWGTPVLYSRVPGGCLFPPVEDEEARQQAQQGLDVRTSLHQAWWDWTDHRAAVSRSQLRYLAGLSESREEAGEPLEVQPAEALLLLRSAVVENKPVKRWLAHLRRAGADLMAELDDAGRATGAAREEASVFDLGGVPQEDRPREAGPVAWTAVRHSGPVTRQTAALALTALPPVPEAGLERIDGALRGIRRPWKRYARRAELRGALADGDPDLMGPANSGLPPWDRLGIWFWRFWRRVIDDRDRVLAITLGAGVGAALALGLFRVLIAILTHEAIGVTFAWYSYLAFIPCGALGLGMALAPPARLIRRNSRTAAAPLGLLLGTVLFAVAHILVMLLFGVKPAAEAYRIGTGALAGFGLALALYGLGRRPWPRVSWLWRVGIASVVLTLAQYLAQYLAVLSGEMWEVDGKFRTSVEFSREPVFYQGYLNPYEWFQSLQRWVQSLGDFHGGDLLALLDALLVGVVLTLGIGLGLAVALRLLDRYRTLVGRAEERRFTLDFDSEPLGDSRVQEAFVLAIDKEPGTAQAFSSDVVRFTAIIGGEPVDAYTYPYDPERALVILEEVAYDRDQAVIILFPEEDAQVGDAARLIAGALGKIDVNVELTPVPGADLDVAREEYVSGGLPVLIVYH